MSDFDLRNWVSCYKQQQQPFRFYGPFARRSGIQKSRDWEPVTKFHLTVDGGGERRASPYEAVSKRRAKSYVLKFQKARGIFLKRS